MNDMEREISDAVEIASNLYVIIGPIYDGLFCRDDDRADLWIILADALHNISTEYTEVVK